MRSAYLRVQIMLGECSPDPRYEIAAIGIIVGMLKLAAAAFWKVPARGLLVVRPGRQRAVVEYRVAGNSECDMPAA